MLSTFASGFQHRHSKAATTSLAATYGAAHTQPFCYAAIES